MEDSPREPEIQPKFGQLAEDRHAVKNQLDREQLRRVTRKLADTMTSPKMRFSSFLCATIIALGFMTVNAAHSNTILVNNYNDWETGVQDQGFAISTVDLSNHSQFVPGGPPGSLVSVITSNSTIELPFHEPFVYQSPPYSLHSYMYLNHNVDFLYPGGTGAQSGLVKVPYYYVCVRAGQTTCANDAATDGSLTINFTGPVQAFGMYVDTSVSISAVNMYMKVGSASTSVNVLHDRTGLDGTYNLNGAGFLGFYTTGQPYVTSITVGCTTVVVCNDLALGFNVFDMYQASVPEPGTLGLVLLGILSIILTRWGRIVW
jgi:hypothetical protein